jgi:hypothetical protein
MHSSPSNLEGMIYSPRYEPSKIYEVWAHKTVRWFCTNRYISQGWLSWATFEALLEQLWHHHH